MSLQNFVPTPQFSDYQEIFKENYKLSRSDDGVILAEAHTLDGPIQLSVENHRSVGQLFKTIGADPDNEVMIFTGTGPHFMLSIDPDGFALEAEDLEYWAYEYAYKDGRINVASLINDLEIPTIGAMNGPGFHSELCLMCDITICTEDTVIFDPHFAGLGSVPGDGIHSCLQELLGVKRAAYALLTGHTIDAQKALELGLVNEVVPRDQLIPRAKELADDMMLQSRTTRRLTTQIVRRPWKKRIVDDLDGGFGIQMFSHLTKRDTMHVDVEESAKNKKYFERLFEIRDKAGD
ncbi:enoyl-CoA hydratase/isomerase family protein [Pseudomaricurvus alkylphenolicus]|uniref:enoyl-CoA hydratase/isomerase family protein n=1 Tax=Pseudomaricurvus alkylphenolicus TaxID=1306991 RepID=UPI0014249141|nr:enoyl-CoA hydratase/isomerase family protein [Pseudomaricurvus alkylphenolicus]NIB38690.1 enoyl-CoA hydratase/isomerase family protein [Pseudomaricurvus alkylphenolicus]